MDLIILYGPPAVGKLTIAKELSKLIKFKVLHVHMTRDVLKSIFDVKDKSFRKLLDDFRIKIVREVSQSKIKGLIYTSGYKGAKKHTVLDKVIKLTIASGGKVLLVHLICSEEELFKRVVSKDRKSYMKTTTVAGLREELPKWKFDEHYPHPNNIVIDNTKISAKSTARKIFSEYKNL